MMMKCPTHEWKVDEISRKDPHPHVKCAEVDGRSRGCTKVDKMLTESPTDARNIDRS